MGLAFLNSQYLSDIADAIRGQNGETTTYKASQMAAAITALGGGSVDLADVEVYIADYYNDTVDTESGVIDVYKRLLVS